MTRIADGFESLRNRPVLRVAVCLLATAIGFRGEMFSQEVSFQKSKQSFQEGEKSKQRDVTLLFLDDHMVVRERKGAATYATIPNDAVTEITYELSKNARITEAILISPLFLLSSSKKHWLTIKYQDQGKIDFVLLELDKKEYQQVIATVEARTGKVVKRVLEQ
jgi:hypothetical protein